MAPFNFSTVCVCVCRTSIDLQMFSNSPQTRFHLPGRLALVLKSMCVHTPFDQRLTRVEGRPAHLRPLVAARAPRRRPRRQCGSAFGRSGSGGRAAALELDNEFCVAAS